MSLVQRFFAFLSAPWTRNDERGPYARVHFAEEQLQEIRMELDDVYTELGHARKTETSMAEELELRREALQELSHGNAVLRDANERYRSKIACLEDAISAMQDMHQRELHELNARLWMPEKQAQNYVHLVKTLEAQVDASRTETKVLVSDIEELVEDKCSEHEAEPASKHVDHPMVIDALEGKTEATLHDEISPRLHQDAFREPNMKHNSVPSMHSVVRFGFEIPVSSDPSYRELREQLDEAMVTMRDTEQIIKEVTSAAVMYKEAAITNKAAAMHYSRIKPTLMATLTRAAMLSTRRTVEGKKISPIVQALHRVLCL